MTQAAVDISTADRIDSIPTRTSPRKAIIVSMGASLLALLGGGFWYWGSDALQTYLDGQAMVQIHLEDEGLLNPVRMWFNVFGMLGAVCGLAGLMSLVRSAATYRFLRAVLVLVYPAVLGYVVVMWLAVFSVANAQVEMAGGVLSRAGAVLLWWEVSWPALLAGVYVFWLHVMLHSRSVVSAFTGDAGRAMVGDHILEDWRTHGRDPRARKSLYGSVLTHVAILVVIPFLLNLDGCVEPYRVPQGSGNPVVNLVQIVKPKKKKKQTLTLRPNSAIIFEIPDLDDTEVDRVMEEMTQATYQASVNAKAGKMGQGGGQQGGWPEGMENYKIRFIRLDHGGAGWDDGMDQTQADMNFLREFAKVTGFNNIANKSESHSIALLEKYPDDGFPPFVYLTGNSGMGRTSSRDNQILRAYLLNGGMLIADAGSVHFDRSFRQFIRRVFPDKQLLDVADDDMIYQLPFGFPNGAPAFWGHGGNRAMGIKHEGRWVVFYHPGDMNDAWKSPGYSDVTPQMRQAAMNLGVNLVYYSFNQWNDAVTRNRK